MRKLFLFFCFPLLLLGKNHLELGVDRFFKEGYAQKFAHKRIGLITNQTGINSSLCSTIDVFLHHQNEIKLQCLFAPEHGLDGSTYAGDFVSDQTYKKIPVYSLHGKTRRPTEKMLQAVDVIVYDLQDLGSRSYTYISTLFYVMEEAAKKNIPVVVLDRPNPMGGILVDGPMLESTPSFLGYINIPYCHGLTVGELAEYFNKEYKVGCTLHVVPMKGWSRHMIFSDTGLQWIPTSPNVPEEDTPFFYATTGILGELDFLHIGIGYTMPFKVVAAPWIDAEKFSEKMNERKISGAQFTPVHYKPFYGSCKNKSCHGIKIHILDTQKYKPFVVQKHILQVLKELYPKEVQKAFKDLSATKLETLSKVTGNKSFLQNILDGKVQKQNAHYTQFLLNREKYLLYE